MGLTVEEQSVLRSLEASVAAERPELSELARFFDQVSGPVKMPRREQLRCGQGGWTWLIRLAVLALLALAAAGRTAWRVLCWGACAFAASEALYSAAFVTGHAPGLSDATSAGAPENRTAGQDPG